MSLFGAAQLVTEFIDGHPFALIAALTTVRLSSDQFLTKRTNIALFFLLSPSLDFQTLGANALALEPSP